MCWRLRIWRLHNRVHHYAERVLPARPQVPHLYRDRISNGQPQARRLRCAFVMCDHRWNTKYCTVP